MTLLEAMSFYCPVIAPNIGGPLELVDKNSGFNIDVKNHDEIIEKLNIYHQIIPFGRDMLDARKEARILIKINSMRYFIIFDQRII